jgi:hypothetical protein
MKTDAVRKKVVGNLDQIDERMLMAVCTMLDQYVNSMGEVVGYEPNGKPLTKAELIQSVEKSEKEFKKGKYFTQAQMEKMFKNKMKHGKA